MLKKLTFALTLIIALASISLTARAATVELDSYEIRLGVDVSGGQLLVAARTNLLNPDTVASFEARLTSRALINAVSTLRDGERIEISYERLGGDGLRLNLPPEIAALPGCFVDFEYTIQVGQMSGNVMALDRSQAWYPVFDGQLARYRLEGSVPPGFSIIAAGDLVTHDEVDLYSEFVWECRTPVDRIALVIGRPDYFKESVLEYKQVKVYLFAGSMDTETRTRMLSGISDQLHFYTGLIGPYSQNRLSVVAITGFPSLVISSGLIVTDERALTQAQQIGAGPLGLALAEQWLGAAVFTETDATGNWFLSGSLPHYLRRLFQRQSGQLDLMTDPLQQDYASYSEIAGTEADVPLLAVRTLDSEAAGHIIYGKGAYIIDKLAQRLGESAFADLLRETHQTFRGKYLSYDDFKTLVAKHDSVGDAATWLHQALTTPGVVE